MKTAIKAVDLIIFDLDGTLVDSSRDIAKAVNFTLKKLGLKEKSVQEISSNIGRGLERLLIKTIDTNENTLLGRAMSLFEEYYVKHSTDTSTLYPGVKDTLEYFKAKKMAVVTNRNHKSAVLSLTTLGVIDYFEDILGGDDKTCVKPSPCPLDIVINQLDIKKDRAIMVGDMDVDVMAGKASGIATCAVTYGIGRKESVLKAGPDYAIDSMSKLKDIIV